jgi:hypothetical protein
MSYQYNIGCSLSNLKGIREFVRNILKDQHVPEIEMSAIVLALDEMCSNLMIHAHHCNQIICSSFILTSPNTENLFLKSSMMVLSLTLTNFMSLNWIT